VTDPRHTERLARRFQPKVHRVTVVTGRKGIQACQRSPIPADACKEIFLPVPLDSEMGAMGTKTERLREMSVDEGGTHYMDLRQMDIEKLPGWMRASEDMRARTVAAAKRFLMRTDFRDMDWFPSKQIPNGASLG
jgi:hypothetical protein